MVGFRAEFEEIIRDYGSEYLLVRNDKQKICKCVDTLYNSAKDNCPICIGTGYINQVDRVSGRNVYGSIPETLSRMIGHVDSGAIASPARRFYLKADSMPSRQDLIIVTGWNEDTPSIDEYTEIYLVNHVEPKRARNGRIEYFIVSTSMDPINATAKLFNVISNSKKLDYYLTVRR